MTHTLSRASYRFGAYRYRDSCPWRQMEERLRYIKLSVQCGIHQWLQVLPSESSSLVSYLLCPFLSPLSPT